MQKAGEGYILQLPGKDVGSSMTAQAFFRKWSGTDGSYGNAGLF